MKCSRLRKRTDSVICWCQLLSICFLFGQKWRKKVLFLIPPIRGKRRKRRRSCQSGATDNSSVYPRPGLDKHLVFKRTNLPLFLSRGKVSCDKTGLSLRPRTSPIKWISWCLKEIGIGLDLMRRSKSSNSEYFEKTKSFRPWKVFLSFSFLPRPQ